jgi:predicted transporter
MKLKGGISMKFRTMAAAVAALTLTASPVLAETSVDRVAAPVEDASQMGGSSLLLILAVVLFGAGIFFLVDNDDDDPDSP